MSFKDHFSGHAARYAGARPDHPAALFAWLAGQCVGRDRAWDAACGNGQAAVALAAHFASVFATDPSAAQIEHALGHPRVSYRVERAEQCSLAAASVDLVTIAQALHWLEVEPFYREVRRVLKPRGVIAAWSYALMRITPAIDRLITHLHDELLGPHWPAERRHVLNGYREIPFPFAPIAAPSFAMRHEWALDRVLAYLGTWSAVPRCRQATGRDPLADLLPALTAAWGSPQAPRHIEWPVSLKVGTV
ncbi:MAG: class I SAM-dependent methyltransferase [Planctomycetota bacterium]